MKRFVLGVVGMALSISAAVAGDIEDGLEAVDQDDFSRAAIFFHKAARHGHPGAMAFLCTLYAEGRGVSQDYIEAMKWCRKAANRSDVGKSFTNMKNSIPRPKLEYLARNLPTEVKYQIARMYALGLGVPQDHVLAHMWANLAAAGGHEIARKARGGIEAYMTTAQIAEAQRMAREWRPKR